MRPQDAVLGATSGLALEGGQKPILALEEDPTQERNDTHETAFQALPGFSKDRLRLSSETVLGS